MKKKIENGKFSNKRTCIDFSFMYNGYETSGTLIDKDDQVTMTFEQRPVVHSHEEMNEVINQIKGFYLFKSVLEGVKNGGSENI